MIRYLLGLALFVVVGAAAVGTAFYGMLAWARMP